MLARQTLFAVVIQQTSALPLRVLCWILQFKELNAARGLLELTLLVCILAVTNERLKWLQCAVALDTSGVLRVFVHQGKMVATCSAPVEMPEPCFDLNLQGYLWDNTNACSTPWSLLFRSQEAYQQFRGAGTLLLSLATHSTGKA